eukprot:m.73459 g.73459  ORF g.73459 m.73459 type:complete len:1080 (+) comp12420_c0_seq2:243-3482(+)
MVRRGRKGNKEASGGAEKNEAAREVEEERNQDVLKKCFGISNGFRNANREIIEHAIKLLVNEMSLPEVEDVHTLREHLRTKFKVKIIKWALKLFCKRYKKNLNIKDAFFKAQPKAENDISDGNNENENEMDPKSKRAKKKALKELLKPKGGMEILSEGAIEISGRPNEIAKSIIKIQNNGENERILQNIYFPLGPKHLRVDEIKVYSKNQKLKKKFQSPNDIKILPELEYSIVLIYEPTEEESVKSMICFKFGGFVNAGLIELTCRKEDKVIDSLRKGLKKKKLKVPVEDRGEKKIVEEGKRPKSRKRKSHPFKNFDKPNPIKIEVEKGNFVKKFTTLQESDDDTIPKTRIVKPLSTDIYKEYFEFLWQVEEVKLVEEMLQYKMHNVQMNAGNRFMRLKVPGLAEKRPSVLRGDKVWAEREGEKYSGYVHLVEKEFLSIDFGKNFLKSHSNGALYDVEFELNRISLLRRYEAIDKATEDLLNFIIPTGDKQENKQQCPPDQQEDKVAILTEDYKDLLKKLETLNGEQELAVRSILNARRENGQSHPFLIWGPPGTGKSRTLVNAICAILLTQPNTKILVCAPSNAATDLLLKRVVSIMGDIKKDAFRLNAASREIKDTDPVEAKEYSSYDDDDDDGFAVPNLSSYRVVFTTLTSSPFAKLNGFQGDYILIDEAGHADEIETLIPMAWTFKQNTRVVLAGDPKQLGPVIHDKFCENFFLNKSMMERLMDHPMFSSGAHPGNVVKLVKNYRSLPEILKLPSELFYNNDLEACCDPTIRDEFDGWTSLPNPKFPIVFHGVQGSHIQEDTSPSFCNLEELKVIKDWVQKLVVEKKVKGENIGIITPYVKQVQKIRKYLKLDRSSEELTNIKTGTAEAFQGDERDVIIISTVRSLSNKTVFEEPQEEKEINDKNVTDSKAQELIDIAFDEKFKLGFLRNAKRFNVSVTRSKKLYIVVGNPYLLVRDDNWGRLLKYCQENDSYTGCFFKDRDEEKFFDALNGGDNGAGVNDGNDGQTSASNVLPNEPIVVSNCDKEEEDLSDGFMLVKSDQKSEDDEKFSDFEEVIPAEDEVIPVEEDDFELINK